MNQTVKQRAVLVEIAPKPIDPIRHMAEVLPKPRKTKKRLVIGWREPGEIVRRGNRFYRVAWTFGPIMKLNEFLPWGL